MTDISLILEKELESRKKINSAYSLRSFAKFLEVSPATLSQVMSSKRTLGRKSEEKILSKLGIKSEGSRYSDYVRSTKTKAEEQRTPSLKLEEDVFQLISNWQYFAILSLSELKDSKADPRWIARKLNIKVEEANKAIKRLERLQIIEILPDNSFKQIAPPLTTHEDIPSEAIRNFHRSVLGLAQIRLEEVPVEEREFRSVTIAGNSKRIKKAKKLIKELKELITDCMETGKTDEVYQLNIQLFPLSKGEK